MKSFGPITKATDKFFTKLQGQGFQEAKKLSRYHLFERREGGFVRDMEDESGKVCHGAERDELIQKHFTELHGTTKNERTKFNPVKLTDELLEKILARFHKIKAEGMDSVSSTKDFLWGFKS